MSELLGISLTCDQKKDSREQLSTWYGKDKKGRDYVVEQAGSLAVSDGEWKYISPSDKKAYEKLTNTELGNAPQDQLYFLKKDIGEKNNLASKNKKRTQRLHNKLQEEMNKGYHQ